MGVLTSRSKKNWALCFATCRAIDEVWVSFFSSEAQYSLFTLSLYSDPIAFSSDAKHFWGFYSDPKYYDPKYYDPKY